MHVREIANQEGFSNCKMRSKSGGKMDFIKQTYGCFAETLVLALY